MKPLLRRISVCAALAMLFSCAGGVLAEENEAKPDPALLGPGGDEAYVRNTDDSGVCADENECMGKYDAHGWEKLLPPVEGTYYERFPKNLPVDKLSPHVQEALKSAGMERARCVYMNGDCLAVCVPGKAGGNGGYCTSLEETDREKMKQAQESVQAEMDKEAKALEEAKRKAAEEKAAQENKAGAMNGQEMASRSIPENKQFSGACEPVYGPLPKECYEEKKPDGKENDILAMNEDESKKRLLENDKQANDNTGGYQYTQNPPGTTGAPGMTAGKPPADANGGGAVNINERNVDKFDASYRAAAAGAASGDLRLKPYEESVAFMAEEQEQRKHDPNTAWGRANVVMKHTNAAAVQAQEVTRKLDGKNERVIQTMNEANEGAAEQTTHCTKTVAGAMGAANHVVSRAGDCEQK